MYQPGYSIFLRLVKGEFGTLDPGKGLATEFSFSEALFGKDRTSESGEEDIAELIKKRKEGRKGPLSFEEFAEKETEDARLKPLGKLAKDLKQKVYEFELNKQHGQALEKNPVNWISKSPKPNTYNAVAKNELDLAGAISKKFTKHEEDRRSAAGLIGKKEGLDVSHKRFKEIQTTLPLPSDFTLVPFHKLGLSTPNDLSLGKKVKKPDEGIASGFIPNFTIDARAKKVLGKNPQLGGMAATAMKREASFGVSPVLTVASGLGSPGNLAVVNKEQERGKASVAKKLHGSNFKKTTKSSKGRGFVPNFVAEPSEEIIMGKGNLASGGPDMSGIQAALDTAAQKITTAGEASTKFGEILSGYTLPKFTFPQEDSDELGVTLWNEGISIEKKSKTFSASIGKSTGAQNNWGSMITAAVNRTKSKIGVFEKQLTESSNQTASIAASAKKSSSKLKKTKPLPTFGKEGDEIKKGLSVITQIIHSIAKHMLESQKGSAAVSIDLLKLDKSVIKTDTEAIKAHGNFRSIAGNSASVAKTLEKLNQNLGGADFEDLKKVSKEASKQDAPVSGGGGKDGEKSKPKEITSAEGKGAEVSQKASSEIKKEGAAAADAATKSKGLSEATTKTTGTVVEYQDEVAKSALNQQKLMQATAAATFATSILSANTEGQSAKLQNTGAAINALTEGIGAHATAETFMGKKLSGTTRVLAGVGIAAFSFIKGNGSRRRRVKKKTKRFKKMGCRYSRSS